MRVPVDMTIIAVTGVTGHVGRRVAEQLSDLQLRLVVRDASRAPSFAGAEVVVTEYSDFEASVRALTGADVLFMVSAAEAEDRRQQHRTFVEAAVTAGVSHIVYTSFTGAAPDAIFTLGRDHADTEAAIRDSGIGFTILRDNFYSDLLPYFADDEGVLRGPAGTGRVAAVARADVADVAASILRDPASHTDTLYELTGPEALTFDEIAERAGAAIGRKLRFENETVEEAYASRSHYGADRYQLDAWVSTYTAIAAGEVATVTDDVTRVTGRPARSIEDAISSVV